MKYFKIYCLSSFDKSLNPTERKMREIYRGSALSYGQRDVYVRVCMRVVRINEPWIHYTQQTCMMHRIV